MTKKITVKVFAKLNLFLDVLGVSGQYHNLSSTALSVDIFDTVEISQRTDNQVTVNSVLNLPATENIAYKTAKLFVSHFNTVGCDIIIKKGIPPMSGLGGSSADASAVLFALCKLNSIDISHKVESLANSLGSDVLFMLRGGLGKLSGRGDTVHFADNFVPCHFAVTTFNQQISTRLAFEQYDKLTAEKLSSNCTKPQNQQAGKSNPQSFDAQTNPCNNSKGSCLHGDYTAEQVFVATKEGRLKSQMLFNALSQATQSLSNYADQYLAFAKSCSLSPCMTGSGSAYFVLCQSKLHAQQTADLLNSKGFATVALSSKPQGIEVMG